MNIPNWYELVLLVLAAWRIFELIGKDTILDRPRRYVTGKLDAKWELFIECPYCAGFWIGLVWWVAWLIWPYETLVFAVPWAISAGVVGAAKILSPD